MTPCQVSIIAEICICHAKICETVLRYKTTLQNSLKNRQSRTTCSYFCSREIKNRNDLACNPDKTEEDHLCYCFQSITFPGID